MLLMVNPQKKLLALNSASNETEGRDYRKLPHPIMKNGEESPMTIYTSKNFDTARSASINSRFIVTEEGEKCDELANECRNPDSPSESTPEAEDDDDDEVEHEPRGQHLLIDIANVDSAFLASEERLSIAMLELVKQCGLTLLSYHCHGMKPSGVSCAGILLESHVSFHTWPNEGVITLDLFTCGPGILLPFVSITKELFAIPSSPSHEQPKVVWSHKFRGFSKNAQAEIAERSDFFRFPIGIMTDYKELVSIFSFELLSSQTTFQFSHLSYLLVCMFRSFPQKPIFSK
jgi:S-adenosylmethionine decarboxylase proenzyme